APTGRGRSRDTSPERTPAPSRRRPRAGEPLVFISWMAVASTVAFMSAAPLRAADPLAAPGPGTHPPVVDRAVPSPADRPTGRSVYRPPVDAAVTSPFDMRAGRYGAGNRGLDYGTAPATPVGAIGDGTVVFAGPVAGDRWVTVLHPDGLR